MRYQNDIPKSTDSIAESQKDLKNNSFYANLRFGQDHHPFTDETGKSGKHKQVTFTDTPKENVPEVKATENIIFYDNTSGEIYSKNHKKQLLPVTPIKAFVTFSAKKSNLENPRKKKCLLKSRFNVEHVKLVESNSGFFFEVKLQFSVVNPTILVTCSDSRLDSNVAGRVHSITKTQGDTNYLRQVSTFNVSTIAKGIQTGPEYCDEIHVLVLGGPELGAGEMY